MTKFKSELQIISRLKKLKNSKVLGYAKTILDSNVKSINHFHSIYHELRKDKAGGPPADNEQDLLRAMLLFAGAGIDAVVKQIIKDSLGAVIDKDNGAQKQFETHVERKIKKGSNDDNSENYLLNSKFMASVIANREPRKVLLNDLIESLTGESLQSIDQLLKVAAHFAITKDEILTEFKTTELAFKTRNKIMHEMDINPANSGKKRIHRTEADMIKYTDNLIKIAESFISMVDKKLT